VVHPGCCTSGSEDDGIGLVAEAIRRVLGDRRRGRAHVLLEQTAGQGSSLGWRFEQLAAMIARAGGHRRVGVCLDTCHLWAAGYDLRSDAGYCATFEAFDRLVGFERLRVFHLNDSKKPRGSRRDRHEHIGRGTIGIDAFRRLVNDARFADLPMLLETPKTEGRRAARVELDPLDAANLRRLRRLRAAARRTRPPGT
jgi:deoxyribonuclease-4